MRRFAVGFVLAVAAIIVSSCSTDLFSSKSVCGEIEWIDFIQINDIVYYYKPDMKVSANEAGNPAGTIQYTYTSEEHPCPKDTRDNGDAAFLPTGTTIYHLKDYKPSFRLLAKEQAKWKVYEVIRNPQATTVRDLYDIEGRIDKITLKKGAVQLTPGELKEFVNTILDAKLLDEKTYAKTRAAEPVFLTFHLNDATTVSFTYWMKTAADVKRIVMSPGIYVPDRIGEIVQAALSRWKETQTS